MTLSVEGGTEYRVRWQREGRGMATRIYQTEAAARRNDDEYQGVF